MKVDGSFLATILETAAVVSLYFAWRGITEGAWTTVVSCVFLTMHDTEDWDVDYYSS
jgi:hypothetical protein